MASGASSAHTGRAHITRHGARAGDSPNMAGGTCTVWGSPSGAREADLGVRPKVPCNARSRGPFTWVVLAVLATMRVAKIRPARESTPGAPSAWRPGGRPMIQDLRLALRLL